MRLRIFLLTIITFFVFEFYSKSQNIPLGTWRTHFSYYSSTSLSVTGDRVYSGSEHGFFYLDKEFNNSSIQSKIQGFSEISVQKLNFSDQNNTVVVAYTNGNIDLISEGKIFNIPVIKNANEGLDKTIHHILVEGNTAFISTGLGLIVLDLKRREVKEAYQNIGVNGEALKVYYSAFLNNHLYLSTSNGLKYGQYSPSINLQDFNNWETFGVESNIPSGKIDVLASFNDQLFAGINGKGIYQLEANLWTLTSLPIGQKIRSMETSSGKLFICQDASIVSLDNSSVEVTSNAAIITPFQAFLDNQNNLWVADSTSGLLAYKDNMIKAYTPNGPFSPKADRLIFGNGHIVSLPGGLSNQGALFNFNGRLGFSKFYNGMWENYGAYQGAQVTIPDMKNFSSATYDNISQTWYYGSLENGILKQAPDNNFTIYNQANSTLSPSQSSNELVKVADVAIDWEGKLWAVNFDVNPGAAALHSKSADDQWEAHPINHIYSNSLVQILIDLSGQKWLRVNPKSDISGIIVYDESSRKSIHLNKQTGQGGLFNAQVNDMVQDKNGYLWLATNNGVSVFYNPYDIVNNPTDATRPIFENQYLLKDTKVTAIAVDGGDRKWVGSQTGGVWLFNDDVSEMIHHFTSENSPLPSNTILDITIHDHSGEVFISTSKGVVSFRADATVNEEEVFSNVKVFPNPVLPNFRGVVAISGLTDNTTVKITDVSGKIIYQATSSGGTASWNLASTKIRSGVYFVFSVSENGEEALVSKVAVID